MRWLFSGIAPDLAELGVEYETAFDSRFSIHPCDALANFRTCVSGL